jgi:hypothetical protein
MPSEEPGGLTKPGKDAVSTVRPALIHTAFPQGVTGDIRVKSGFISQLESTPCNN